MEKIQITTPGIKKALRRYNVPRAIAQYVWNGFDAQASTVDIVVDSNSIGYINNFSVMDNGYGIPHEELGVKFKPFFESEKEIDPDQQRETSAVHGKNGVGRLTFFTFAQYARWDTVYELDGKRYAYSIEIESNELETYKTSEIRETNEPTGTTVIFRNIHDLTKHEFETEIADFFMKEFGWFLELNKHKSYSLTINEKNLDYYPLIGDSEEFNIGLNGQHFKVRYIRWNEFIREYSRYYFLDSYGDEKFKKTTKLNNKGDHYYHSVFIQSNFFDKFGGSLVLADGPKNQEQMFASDEKEEVYNQLLDEVDKYLREKRRPFLKKYADKLIVDFEEEEAFPKYSGNEWDKFREEELKSVVRELYQVEPKIFTKLNTEQKRTFIHLLDLVIDAGERDRLLNIIGEIVNLEPEERVQLDEILLSSSLSNIVKTIKLIEDRYRAIDELKSLVFSKELNANEPQHIQKFIEKHYWIFGEQYHLVTAAEPKFEEALKRYIHLLRGKKEEIEIDHPDKYGEMDIFIVRQDVQNELINNVVVELKNPKIRLGATELDQVKRYMGVITSEDEFNAPNMRWDFFLIGNKFDTSGRIESELENAKIHGERSLVFKDNSKNYKIYVKTWSEIFADFELRHRYLNKKLQLQRKNLINEHHSADEIIENLDNNTAVQPPEYVVPG
jgi:hypothetical protein